MSSFSYTPLNNPKSDLRLVLPCSMRNGRLECRLFARQDNFKYQALSYTWGDETKKVPITLNDETFLVTQNLEEALRKLYSKHQERKEWQTRLPLWIDAVCINQEDIEERDEQVRRMKSIYEQAECVLIWLGNYNEPSDETFRLDLSKWDIDRLEENSPVMARSALVLAHVLKEEVNHQQGSEISISFGDCIHSNELQVWAQLSRLFHRPWFERLWVIQELAVSRKAIVLWGDISTTWETLEKAAKFILRPGIVPEQTQLPRHIRKILPLFGAHRIAQVDLQSMFNVDTSNILTILHNTQTTKCSDPRDRLYAIRGIVEDNQDIDIDYSIPLQQVYRQWAVKRIRRTGTLDILSACADSSRRGDLPSWVPDLRRPFGQDKPLWIRSQISEREFKSKSSELRLDRPSKKRKIEEIPWRTKCRNLKFLDDGLKMSVSGQYVGKVGNLTTIGDVVTDLPDPTDLEARLRKIIGDWHYTLSTPQRIGRGDSLDPKGFRECLLRSFYPWATDPGRLSEDYDTWAGKSSTFETAHGFADHSQHEANMRSLERNLFSRVHGCQMFTIESGRTGIVAGNCETQIGDELWLLSGGLTAFVLRRVNEVEHRLISPCYLFGKMHWMHKSPTGHDARKRVILI